MPSGDAQVNGFKCENGERRVDVIDLSKFAELYGVPLSWFPKGKGRGK